MKVYKSLEEKVDHVLVNVIGDVHPELALKMRADLFTEDLKINDLIKKARALLLPTEKGTTGRYYWLARGWSVAIAQAKIVEARKHRKPKLSPYSIQFWMIRQNPDTGKLFTGDEAELKRNSLRPIRSEYWIIRGHSAEESAQLAKDAKDANNKAGAKAVKTRKSEEIRSFSPRCVEYWAARGYSKDAANAKVKETQVSFSLGKLQDKFGEEEGLLKWKQRQDRWQTTLNSKSDEELEDINQRKIWKSGSMSKVSQMLFEKIHINGSRWGRKTDTNAGEMMITLGNKRAMVDFAYNNKIIEFYGDYWHANPNRYSATDIIITRRFGPINAKEIWENDKHRISEIESLAYKVHIVWESDFKQHPEKVIQECKNFLLL